MISPLPSSPIILFLKLLYIADSLLSKVKSLNPKHEDIPVLHCVVNPGSTHMEEMAQRSEAVCYLSGSTKSGHLG